MVGISDSLYYQERVCGFSDMCPRGNKNQVCLLVLMVTGCVSPMQQQQRQCQSSKGRVSHSDDTKPNTDVAHGKY